MPHHHLCHSMSLYLPYHHSFHVITTFVFPLTFTEFTLPSCPWLLLCHQWTPEDAGHITEHNTTCLTLKLYFICLRRASYWSSANMVRMHFWQIEIFFLGDSLVKLMTWLYDTYNNIEVQTLKIFLSSSYEMWRALPSLKHFYIDNFCSLLN